MSVLHIIKLLVAFILILSLAYLSVPAGISSEAEEDSSSVQVRSQEEIIDPHFTGKDCDVCHEIAPKPGDKDDSVAADTMIARRSVTASTPGPLGRSGVESDCRQHSRFTSAPVIAGRREA